MAVSYKVVYERLLPNGSWQRTSTYITANSSSEAANVVKSQEVNAVRIISVTQ